MDPLMFDIPVEMSLFLAVQAADFRESGVSTVKGGNYAYPAREYYIFFGVTRLPAGPSKTVSVFSSYGF